MITKKNLILIFCFLSFSISSINTFTPEGKYDTSQKIALAIIPSYIGAMFLLFGVIFSALGENTLKDIPTTDAQRHFFVLRNYLPKEDLDRIKEHDKHVALRQIKMSKIFYALSALCFVGGITGAFFEDIKNIFKYGKFDE